MRGDIIEIQDQEDDYMRINAETYTAMVYDMKVARDVLTIADFEMALKEVFSPEEIQVLKKKL